MIDLIPAAGDQQGPRDLLLGRSPLGMDSAGNRVCSRCRGEQESKSNGREGITLRISM